VFALAGLLGCEDDTRTREVRYEVTGSAQSVMITMTNSGGNIEQYSDIAVPWNTSFSVTLKKGGMDEFFFASIMAQNEGESGGVTVRILVDDEVISESSSSGAYTIASADEMIGF